MPTVAIAMTPVLRQRFFHPDQWLRLQQVATVTTIDAVDDLRSPEAARALADADVLVTGWGTGPVDDAVLAAAPLLRGIVHTGGSVRSIVGPEVFARGIVVSSQTEENAQPVAEYTVAMIMLAAKDVFRSARLYRDERDFIDREERFPEAGLYKRKVGIVGLSRISRKAIELLRPYETDLYVYSRHLDDEEASRLGVTPAGLDEIFAGCEVISLHSASLPETRHMVDADLLRLIRPGATFINTARGALVDQDALIRELGDGRFDAILDVADPDVTAADSPLWHLPNVTLTPHFAGAVGHELWRLGGSAVQDVADILGGVAPRGEIAATALPTRA